MKFCHYLALLTLPFLWTFCKADSSIDKNLQSIVDFTKALSEETPSQFGAHNFKTYFESRNVPQTSLKDRQKITESRTHMFQQSFLRYIKEVYNNKSYALRLSQDASHIVQFFDLCNEMNLVPDLAYVGFRLFYNKIKACELIDDTVILELLETIPSPLEHYFKPFSDPSPLMDITFIQKQTETIILTKFTEHMPDFQKAPDVFISQLSKEIAHYFQQEVQSNVQNHKHIESCERLRQIIFRFFDTAISKAIWNPKAPEGIWRSFISIAHGLQLLGNHNIIDHMDDLDDLLWTLTHRFSFFLDLTGASLPTSFYEEVEHDLANKSIFFLEFKEQDEGITSKKETLMNILIQAKAKAFAYEKKGIISMPMM